MNQPDFLKCPCQSCGESIEFPADGIGQTVSCPHCGQSTALSIAPAAESMMEAEIELAQRRSNAKSVWLLVLAAVIVAGGAAMLAMKRKSPEDISSDSANGAKTPEASQAIDGTITPTNTAPASANTVRSMDDLKAGAITLEKAKGGSLVYAVGVLRNNSDLQRFGVAIELELADARGNSAGTARDYRSVIEPRQEWRFRALILDSKAVSARLAKIREEQ